MDVMDDKQLVQLMRTGDPSGFDAVYERYAKALFRTAFLICGDTGDAEDAVQETFVICFTSISQLRHEESLRFWLYRILTRAARDISRRHARETADEHIAERVDEELCRDGSMTAIDANIPEAFGNGYAFKSALPVDQQNLDADNNVLSESKAISVVYGKTGAVDVELSVEPRDSQLGDNSGARANSQREFAGVMVSYNHDEYLICPDGYQLSDEQLERQQNDEHFFVSYGDPREAPYSTFFDSAAFTVGDVTYGYIPGGSGYVAYADSGVHDRFDGVRFYGGNEVQIMASANSSAFYTNSELNSGHIGCMTQQNAGGTISIVDSALNVGETGVQIKSGAANNGFTNVVLDGTEVTFTNPEAKWGGTLVELVESDDAGNPGNTSFTIDDRES